MCAAGAPAPRALGAEQDAVRKTYSLQSEDGVRSYWADLENICATSARSAAPLLHSWRCLVMTITAGGSSTCEDEACVTAAADGSILRAELFLANSAGVVQACSQDA